MRNVLIHRYDEISLPILWQTIRRNLPTDRVSVADHPE